MTKKGKATLEGSREDPSWTIEGTAHLKGEIKFNLADAFIQSDLQLIRLSRRHTPWSNMRLRALLKGPKAVQILSWTHQGSNHRPVQVK